MDENKNEKKHSFVEDDTEFDIGSKVFENIEGPDTPPGERKEDLGPVHESPKAKKEKPFGRERSEGKKGIVFSGNLSGGTERISIYVSRKTRDFLKFVCNLEGKTISGMLRELTLSEIKKYQDKYEIFEQLYHEKQ